MRDPRSFHQPTRGGMAWGFCRGTRWSDQCPEEVPGAVGGTQRLGGGGSQGADWQGQPAGQALVYFILSTDWRAVMVEGKQRCFSLRLLVALMSVD